MISVSPSQFNRKRRKDRQVQDIVIVWSGRHR